MAQLNDNPIRVGLLGAGTVGSQTARLLVEQKDELAARIGRPIELVGVACLDPDEVDFPWIDKSLLTTDTMKVATNADIVVELIGGTTVARTFVMAAIESGASVVTANKALLAKYGPEIYTAAEAKGVDIYFEAAVGGAIPFLLPLRESLAGDKVTSMLGIVNGTTNYILDEMTTKGLQFDDVLKDAQAKGYAEADPTGDIEGYDAANKAAIMATLGFHTNVTIDDVSVEGITKITADDIAAAAAEVAQWALNVAMNANPIMIVVTAIGALVAALAWFFTQTETGRNIWSQFTAFMGGCVNNIIGFFQALPGRIGAFFQNAAQGAQNAWNGVVGFFSSIPGRILSALGNVGGLLVNAGKSIIDGFLRGLKSAWDGVTGFVGGIADWITSHKGPISYDRRLLIPHGKAIMAGFAQGLETGFQGKVRTAIASVNTRLASTSMSAMLNGTRAGLAGTTVVNNYEVHIDGTVADPDGTAKAIRKLLADYEGVRR